MSISTSHDRLADSVSQLLALGLTQLSIQVTLSTSLTASALGLATLATALTSTILTVQGSLVPYWQWALLPSVAAMVTGLLATAGGGAEHVGEEDVHAAYRMAATHPQDVGITMLGSLQRAFRENDRVLQGKRRLIAVTLGCLLLSVLLIGLLNVAGRATLGSP